MFYAFVIKFSMVKENLSGLLRGKTLDFTNGYIRWLSEKNLENVFVVRDMDNDVSFRAKSQSLVVTRGGDPLGKEVIISPRKRDGAIVLADFDDENQREDVREFLATLAGMQAEYDIRNGIINRLKRWFSDPMSKLVVAGGIVYGVITLYVLLAG